MKSIPRSWPHIRGLLRAAFSGLLLLSRLWATPLAGQLWVRPPFSLWPGQNPTWPACWRCMCGGPIVATSSLVLTSCWMRTLSPGSWRSTFPQGRWYFQGTHSRTLSLCLWSYFHSNLADFGKTFPSLEFVFSLQHLFVCSLLILCHYFRVLWGWRGVVKIF